MNETRADSPAAGNAGLKPKSGTRWPLRNWLTLVALAFATHVILIFVFGAKKPIVPRVPENVPQLALADDSNGLIALDDPTLFVLPHAGDFAASRMTVPVASQPSFRWSGPPGELAAPVVGSLGAVFHRFMQTNQFAAFQLNFKLEPALSAPQLQIKPALPENSTLQITGGLASRPLLGVIVLPSLPCNNVMAPSTLQLLVDVAGDVVSAVLLPPDNAAEAAGRTDAGDTNALQIARGLRFAPAADPAFGELIFNWHTVRLDDTPAP